MIEYNKSNQYLKIIPKSKYSAKNVYRKVNGHSGLCKDIQKMRSIEACGWRYVYNSQAKLFDILFPNDNLNKFQYNIDGILEQISNLIFIYAEF